MAEGTEFLVQLEADTSGPKAMDRELDRMDDALASADRLLKKTEGHMKDLGPAAGKAGGGFKTFVTGALSHLGALAAFDGLKMLSHSILEVGQDALQIAGEAQQTRNAFHLLLGEQPGDDLLDWMERFSKVTQFTGDDIKNFGLDLTHAGFAGEDLRRGIAAVSDIAAMSKNPIEGAGRALAALQQIQLTGSISKGSLRSFGLNDDQFFAHLGKRVGLSVKQVKQQIQEGKLATDDILETLYGDLTAKTGKKLGGAGKAGSKGFLSQLTKVKDLIPNLFQSLESSKGLDGITKGLNHLVEMLDPSAPTGKRIADGLTGMLDRFGAFIEKIDFDKVGEGAEKAFAAIDSAAKAVLWTLDRMYDLVKGLTVAWKALSSSSLDPIDRAIAGNRAVDARKTGNKTLDSVTDSLLSTGGIGGRIGVDIGQRILDGLGLGLRQGKGDVQAATSAVGAAAEEGLMSSIDAHSPSRVFAKIGGYATKGFAIGVRGGAPEVQGEMDSTFSPDALMRGGGQGGGGGSRNEITINVSVGAGVDQAGARDVGQTIASAIRAELNRMQDQLQFEGGSA